MRIHFGQCVPIVFRQANDVVLDSEFVFSYDGYATITHQLVIVEEATCNGVFDSQHPDDRAVLLNLCKDFLEGIATDEFDFLVREELVGSYVVERARNTLYSYSFHNSLVFSFFSLFLVRGG
jgi:hypothetical protein